MIRFATCALFCLFCLFKACSGQEQSPDIALSAVPWTDGPQQLQASSVPRLKPIWTLDTATLVKTEGLGFLAGMAFTRNFLIVAFCSPSPGCGTGYLISFDSHTGKRRSAAQFARIKNHLGFFSLYRANPDTVLTSDDDFLTEFDESLKQTHQIPVPRGLVLGQRQFYGYGTALQLIHSDCVKPGNFAANYALNSRRNLIIACGRDVAVTDENWLPLFAEKITLGFGDSVGIADFSQDGNRFILTLNFNMIEPPVHYVMGFLLYDLRGTSPRRVAFSVEGKWIGVFFAVSPDGSLFATLGENRLSVFKLPD